MYKKICVTNRALAAHPFEEQIARVLDAKPDMLILREKDLGEAEYEKLAAEVKTLGERTETQLVLHSYPSVARKLGISAIHMPLAGFTAMSEEEKAQFTIRGASVHSVEDALRAERAGATYVTAGHIYATDCKKAEDWSSLRMSVRRCRFRSMRSVESMRRTRMPASRQARSACA